MNLGADLILLAVDDKNGDIRFKQHLGRLFAGAQLIEQALAGEVTLSGSHLVWAETDAAEPADPAESGEPAEPAAQLTVADWIARHGSLKRVNEELRALDEDGAVKVATLSSRVKQTSISAVHLADPARQTAVADRFRAAAAAAGRDDEIEALDEALMILAHTAELTPVHLRGSAKRRALKQIAALIDAPVPAGATDRTARIITRRTVIAVTRRIGVGKGRPDVDTWTNDSTPAYMTQG